jgi:hypothetical protein
MSSNRRYSRFLPDDRDVAIQTSIGDRVMGRVVNESYGGLGVHCEQAGALHIDENVIVELEEGRHPARIVAIRNDDDGAHIGLQWLQDDAAPTSDDDSHED